MSKMTSRLGLSWLHRFLLACFSTAQLLLPSSRIIGFAVLFSSIPLCSSLGPSLTNISVNIAKLQVAQDQGLVAGIAPANGQLASRLEIDDLLLDTELANLYFLALEAFMAEDTWEDRFSYFQIAGIHALGVGPWDGVEKPTLLSGYGTHAHATFPMWHRVYLAQFEQALFLHAARIASELGTESLLERFRIPYFDPTLPRLAATNAGGTYTYTYGVPVVVGLPRVRVRRPNTTEWVEINNPLYQFDFPAAARDAVQWADMAEAGRQHTFRSTTSDTSKSNHSQAMDVIDSVFNPAKDTRLLSGMVGSPWRILFESRDYTQMAVKNAGMVLSVENYFQTLLAGLAGNDGHMGNLAVAGFDPFLWLHLCNVDRLVAIWQGLRSRKPESESWWTDRDGYTPATPLKPFRRKAGGPGAEPVWWDSTDARDHRRFGYDYPVTAAAWTEPSLYNETLAAWAVGALSMLSVENPGPPDETTRDHLKDQSRQPVASFPDEILLDGVTPFPAGQLFIGSMALRQGGPEARPSAWQGDRGHMLRFGR